MSDHSRQRWRASQQHRLRSYRRATTGDGPPMEGEPAREAMVDCGWGRLIFAQTFETPEALAQALRAEGPDRRDIALYVRDPHVVLSVAPQELFLDPSHTYRIDLATYRMASRRRKAFSIRRLTTREDAEAVNAIYAARHMVPVPPEFFWSSRDARLMTVLVAEDNETGEVLGSVMGIDHRAAFNDPEGGSSLWCLAVSPQAPHAGIGEALVRRLSEQFKGRGCASMDLSVLHDNEQAIALYEKLGFRRVPVFCIKRKNPINEKLFTGTPADEKLNPYARIIVDEARRRGIFVEVVDAEGGFFRLSYGGRSVLCRESLSEFTSAVAMSICDDKRVTRRMVEAAGVRVPDQIDAGDRDAWGGFLERHGSVVVKPVRGEQGRGISVGLAAEAEIARAVDYARTVCADVVLEACFEGDDLRLIVIDERVVATAVRLPARVIGDGRSSIADLIAAQSRRRAAATGGESRIPLDAETERCIQAAGYAMEDLLPQGVEVAVRKTANLHTGGTIHDMTEVTHPVLIDAAVRAAKAIEIPVVGVDLMVKSASEPEYVFIEANERPGLANHEPQPTAERFVDLLFPQSMPLAARTIRRKRQP